MNDKKNITKKAKEEKIKKLAYIPQIYSLIIAIPLHIIKRLDLPNDFAFLLLGSFIIITLCCIHKIDKIKKGGE